MINKLADDKLINRIKEVFSRVLAIDAKEINEETSQENSSEWDSMNHLLIITEIEKEFDMNITIEKSIELNTFSKFVDLVAEKKNETN